MCLGAPRCDSTAIYGGAHLLILTCQLCSIRSWTQNQARDSHLCWAACKSSDPQQPLQNKPCQLPAEPWHCQNCPAAARAASAMPVKLLEYLLPTNAGEICPSIFKCWGQGMLLVLSLWVLPKRRWLCSGWHTACVQGARALILDQGMKH